VAPSSLRPAAWAEHLQGHPDPQTVGEFLRDITDGAPLGYAAEGGFPSHARRNLPSAVGPANEQVLQDAVDENVRLGRTIGPFDPRKPPFAHYAVSPIGLLRKTVWMADGSSKEKLRVLSHFSYPFGGRSVNAGLRTSKIKYASFDDALDAIRAFGPGCFMAKLDVKSAFRLIPVDPRDVPLLGFILRGLLYFETCLPFGLNRSPEIWHKPASLLAWILNRAFRLAGIPIILVWYVDDFLLVGRSREHVQASIYVALDIGRQLGLPWELSKLVGPTTDLAFVGLGIDSISMTVYVPAEKAAELAALLRAWQAKPDASRSETKRLAGKLQFLSRAVQAGRTFARRILDLARSFPPSASAHRPRLPVPADLLLDVAWWSEFLTDFSCRVPIRVPTFSDLDKSILTTDSSGARAGALLSTPGRSHVRWLSFPWPEHVLALAAGDTSFSIDFLELAAILLALSTWPPTTPLVLVQSDNQGAVAAINAGTSRVPRMMYLLRRIWLICAKQHIQLVAVHLPGKLNTRADALSRDDVLHFLSITPEADPLRSVPPEDWLKQQSRI
jgi:hypothetical protein